jgi:hypothetical protein
VEGKTPVLKIILALPTGIFPLDVYKNIAFPG